MKPSCLGRYTREKKKSGRAEKYTHTHLYPFTLLLVKVGKDFNMHRERSLLGPVEGNSASLMKPGQTCSRCSQSALPQRITATSSVCFCSLKPVRGKVGTDITGLSIRSNVSICFIKLSWHNAAGLITQGWNVECHWSATDLSFGTLTCLHYYLWWAVTGA